MINASNLDALIEKLSDCLAYASFYRFNITATYYRIPDELELLKFKLSELTQCLQRIENEESN